jgi:hypothetical protein
MDTSTQSSYTQHHSERVSRGDRVERISDGATGEVEHPGAHEWCWVRFDSKALRPVSFRNLKVLEVAVR